MLLLHGVMHPGSIVKYGPRLEGTLCVRSNGLDDTVRLLRRALSSQECRNLLVDLKADVVYDEGASRTHPLPPPARTERRSEEGAGATLTSPHKWREQRTRSSGIRQHTSPAASVGKERTTQRIPKWGVRRDEGIARRGTHLRLVGLAPKRPREVTAK